MTRRGWLLAGLLIACLTVVACKSSAKEPAPSTPTARTTATPSPANDANAPLRDLASRVGTAEATVIYNYTTPSGPGRLTAYWKQPDWRFDYTTAAGPGTAGFLSATGYICTQNNGGECTQTQSFTDVPLNFLSFFTEPGALAGLIGVAGPDAVPPTATQRTIARQAADCFAVSPATELCFGADGLLLSMSGADSTGAAFTLEATSTEPSIPDGILKPPYPPCECGLP